MRYDALIIYSHGLPYIREIMSVVRDFPNIQIEFIKKMDALTIKPSMGEFIEGLYACDKVPFQHLVGKTAYLADLSPEFMFVLLKNLEPDEKMFGEGEFAHVQCARIKELKETIRNNWNPRDSDGKRTEEHVVHGSDSEAQTEYVLGYLGLPPLATFKKETQYGQRYFVRMGKHKIKKIPISKIICRTAFGESSVEDGIWYKYVQGDKQPYIDYMEKVIGIQDRDDHYPEQFDKLMDGFAYNDLITVRETEAGFQMRDGNHRAAIVASWGETEMVAIVEPMLHDARLFKKVLSDCVVIRRKPHFPGFYEGEDIDLLATDPRKTANKVKKICPDCVISERENGLHVDFFKEGELHLRLDLTTGIIAGDENYIKEVFERSFVRGGFRYPNPTDDKILRGIEYALHPEKKWHFDFISETKGTMKDFDFEKAQEYELRANTQWVGENYDKMWAGITAAAKSKKARHYCREFFNDSQEEMDAFMEGVKYKECLEVSPGICGALPFWKHALMGGLFAIDPLIKEYDEHLKSLGDSWFDGIQLVAQCAEDFDMRLEKFFDGFIFWRNGINHYVDPYKSIETVSRYAAKGCTLFFWAEIKHAYPPDEGHRDVTGNPQEVEDVIVAQGWKILYLTPSFDGCLGVQYGCVAVKE